MSVEEVVIDCLKHHPGASAKKIVSYCKDSCVVAVKEHQFKSVIAKKLRILRRKKIVHNQRNAWYLIKPKK